MSIKQTTSHKSALKPSSLVKAFKKIPGGYRLFRLANLAATAVRPKVVRTTFFGAKMNCDRRDYLQNTIAEFGVWEPIVSWAFQQVIKPGDTVIDVGANVGYDTLLAARLVGPSGLVISVEASPTTYSELQANLALNRHFHNIEAHQLAVSDRTGTILLYSAPVSNNSGTQSTVRQNASQSATQVECQPLDRLVSAEVLRSVSFIKIDVEGAEPPIVEQLLSTLHLYSVRLSLLIEMGPEASDIFQGLLKAGFNAYALENEYTYRWYWDAAYEFKALPILQVPMQQQDVLFTRRVLHANLTEAGDEKLRLI